MCSHICSKATDSIWLPTPESNQWAGVINQAKIMPADGKLLRRSPNRVWSIFKLYKRPTKEVVGYVCSMQVTSTVKRCGFNSITYGSHTPIIDRQEFLDPRQCQKLGEEGVLNYHGRTWSGIKRNAPWTLMYYVHGNINDNRSCTTAKFAVEGILLEDSYERRSLKVSAETVRGGSW